MNEMKNILLTISEFCFYLFSFSQDEGMHFEQKSYVVVPAKKYQALQKKAALKAKPEKTLSLAEARKYSRKLIKKWSDGK